jgi:hypothetical protein
MSRAERHVPGSRLPQDLAVDCAPRADLLTSPIKVVIAATTNEKKLSFLTHIFRVPVLTPHDKKGGGPENQSLGAIEIVREKINHIQPFAQEVIKRTSTNAILMIAADITTHTGTLDAEGRSNVQAQNKPNDIVDIKQVFTNMIEDSYFIEAASEVRPVNGHQDGIPCYASIRLLPEKRRRLVTQGGFRTYMKTLDAFLKSPVYLNREEGVTHCPDPTGIAGGIELAVLMRLGIVAEIDGISKDIPAGLTPKEQKLHQQKFEAALENALYLANAGFDRDALRPYVPDIDEAIHSWPWLQGIVAYALGQTT